MQDPGVVWPWLLATVVFLVLLGSGRTVRGRWLGRPPFGAGLLLSLALGVVMLSLDAVLLGHLGLLRSPWPQALLALGALIALPGLWWTWQDWRLPAPGLERGFGLGWFTPVAWLMLIAAIGLSAFWITGAFDWEARGLLFERIGVDHEIGRVAYDEALPRDPFLGDEPLDLWLYALGSAEATLALSWWLAVALLFGVCGLGWRLHSHGAGLLAAAIFAVALFTTDRPLFVAPALPATVALLAVMILAVESRGRPNWGHSGVAGLLGGFALVSDLGAAAMLLPLLLLGPLWCKLASPIELRRPGDDVADALAETPKPEPEPEAFETNDLGGLDDDFVKFGEEDKAGKWRTPLKHTGIGAVGLALPLVPWMARNDAWTDDPLYGFRGFDRVEYSNRWDVDYQLGYRLKLDYRFVDDEPDDDPAWKPYLGLNEWGLGAGIVTGFGLAYGRRRKRRQTLLYGGTAALGWGAGAAFGDFDLTHPSSIGLLSVTAGSSLEGFRASCGERWSNFSYGGCIATGGLALGLSGAYDCGYWDEKDTGDWTPSIQAEYRYYDDWMIDARYRFSEDYQGDEPRIQLRYDTPRLDLDLGLRYEYGAGEDDPATPQVPTEDPRFAPSPEYPIRGDETDEEEGDARERPRTQPRIPGYRPDVRPDTGRQVQPQVQPPRYRTNPRY